MDIKYEYYVHVWGGFFNDHNKIIHGVDNGPYWFDEESDRQLFLDKLFKLKDQLIKQYNRLDLIIATKKEEGYHTRDFPKLHRVCRYKGKEYYSEYSTLEYHMEWKWYPGLNDYVIEEELNESIDYDDVEIISEWISGSFAVYNNKED